MTRNSVHERLTGSWERVSYQEFTADGSEPVEPLGRHPQGLLLYSPDGYMPAHIARSHRPGCVSGDRFAGTPAECGAEATSCIAYAGPFHVDENAHTVTHHVFVSLFPNRVGGCRPDGSSRRTTRRA